MRSISTLLVLLLLASSSFAQKKEKKSKGKKISSFEVNYSAEVEATSDEAQMVAMFLAGAEMKFATDGTTTYVKNVLGMMGTQETLINKKTNEMTMYMSGMTEAAYQGNMDELEDDEETATAFEYFKDTKVILGKKCKKATTTDAEAGSTSTFWYCEEYAPANNSSLMAENLPGLCLEMEIKAEGFNLTYTATDLTNKVNMSDYKIEIPEGVEILPLSEMANMGM